MDRFERYEREMAKLGEYLLEPRTARQITQKMKISKPTAYDRLSAMRKRAAEMGLQLRKTLVREGTTGPRSWAYFLDDPRSKTVPGRAA